jgi:hypothetical protein
MIMASGDTGRRADMDRRVIVGIVAVAVAAGLAAGLFLPAGGRPRAESAGSIAAGSRPIMYEFSSDT